MEILITDNLLGLSMRKLRMKLIIHFTIRVTTNCTNSLITVSSNSSSKIHNNMLKSS